MNSRIPASILVLLVLFCLGSLAVVCITAGVLWQNSLNPSPTPLSLASTMTASPQPQSATPTSPPSGDSQATPSLTPTRPISAEDAAILKQMEQIERQVATLRGLPLLQPVQRRLMNAEELRRHVEEDFLKDYSAEEARQDAQVLSVFGLLNSDYDLYSLYLDLYSEQVAGFYDSETKEMYVVQGGTFGGMERSTYAHEFTHALQDQHYDLREGLKVNPDYCKEDSEYCAAVQALIEGDASLTEQYWLYQHGTAQDRRDIEAFYANYSSPVLDTAPSFLREDFAFPYREGVDFALTLFQENGYEAIDAAFANPPVSTEMILHPEKYPDDRPVTVSLPPAETLLNRPVEELDRGVMGEWYTYLILAHGLQENWRIADELARQAAAGWEGDAYAVFWDETANQAVMVLLSEWESERDAGEFRQAFTAYARLRWGEADQQDLERGWLWQETADGVIFFQQRGSQTLWLIVPREADLPLLKPTGW
ncbi:MAG: hypothetical protein KatS3mg045_0378 [Bellilinea sp.]|nr:MAG: hypothetical protein KatS3mg045_0378 [Bellilinea sp.]